MKEQLAGKTLSMVSGDELSLEDSYPDALKKDTKPISVVTNIEKVLVKSDFMWEGANAIEVEEMSAFHMDRMGTRRRSID